MVIDPDAVKSSPKAKDALASSPKENEKKDKKGKKDKVDKGADRSRTAIKITM